MNETHIDLSGSVLTSRSDDQSSIDVLLNEFFLICKIMIIARYQGRDSGGSYLCLTACVIAIVKNNFNTMSA